ncbi:alkyl/aryl-sulfatase [Pararhodobacter sp. CCB-MM2]|uniref:alkyl/aryl-sulfatase n=1 Tax=Pararhodobacter sp. CCB-MM2 TaxID=1786003 RepID=UPI000834F212|nr:alkyl sulfatase dimerization domain-containing protein [Pararhodobacter sp. CCB-MM2]
MTSTAKPASAATIALNRAAAQALPEDLALNRAEAERGLIAALDPGVILSKDGSRPVWDLTRYAFLDPEETPDTVHPALWQQARLNRIAGLFEVVPGVYQLRGFDLSNMTLIEGERGVIVVDPLVSADAAAAALAFYRRHRGPRPVTAIVYTHCHADHYGGARGIVTEEEATKLPILAPEGFLHEAISETLLAGHAMYRRTVYFSGAMLEKGPLGQVDSGLGKSVSTGRVTLIAPNDEIRETGERRVLDGVEFVFQMAPDTEAPAEFLFYLPAFRTLCAAELATRTMHNLYTLRGAAVRSAVAWWQALDQAVALFGDQVEAMIAQHHWPAWGRDRIVALLERQRDLYKHLHDQTLRLANQGLTAPEIAEALTLPVGLSQAWDCLPFYGTASHNAKGVFQRYLGWYDSHPATLNPHPPRAAAERYVAFMGGADAVVAKARESFDAGDYRWVAEVLRHVVFARPDHRPARDLQADALEQLGYQSSAASWRNEYLTAAHELRHGILTWPAPKTANPDQKRAMTAPMLLDYLGIRLNAARAEGLDRSEDITLAETGESYRLTLRNGALTYRPLPPASDALTVPRKALEDLAFGGPDAGATPLFRLIAGLLDSFDPGFPVIDRPA